MGKSNWKLPAFICGMALILTPVSTFPRNPDELRAQLRARTQTVLSAPVSARLMDFPVEEGQSVKAGQCIAAFDCSEQAAALRSVEARRDAAAANLESQRRLHALSSGSVLEISLAQAEMAMAEAEISRIKAILAKCTVTAPFSGTITSRAAYPHQYLAEGQPMVELTDVKSLEVEMILPAEWLTWLRKDLVFQFTTDATGQREQGRVRHIVGRVDPVSQTIRVIGILEREGGGKLLPGMSGFVSFPDRDRETENSSNSADILKP
jgi:membrane fusion protein, multidrug efflux system